MNSLPRILVMFAVTASFACGGGIDDKSPAIAENSKSETSTNHAANNVANSAATNNAANNVANNTTTAGEPCVEISPRSIEFPLAAVGDQHTSGVLVENCSATELLTIDGFSSSEGFEVMLADANTVNPGASVSVTVVFEPRRAGDYAGEVSLVTNAGPQTVTLTGTGVAPDTGCPTPVARVRTAATEAWTANVTTAVGRTAMLSASQSMAEEPIESYEWTIVTKPIESTTTLSPGPDVESPSLFLDAHGTYVLELRVSTASSPSDCGAVQLTILAEGEIDPNALVISLVWDTPADADQTDTDGTDLDLHYKVEGMAWNAAPYDCYWLNPDEDWGDDGQVVLDREDLDGAGPEEITHSYPSQDGSYSIAVHYFADKGFGVSDATVRIHQSGVLLLEKEKLGLANQQVWYVGDYVMSFAALVVNDGVTNDFPAAD